MKKKHLVMTLFVSSLMLGIYQSQTSIAAEQKVMQESSSVVESTSNPVLHQSTSQTTESSTKESEESLPKIIGVKNQTLALKQVFDPKAGVTATDAKDGVLTNKVEVTGKVDTSKAGTYKLTYSVVNSQGKKSEKSVSIDVQPKEATSYRAELSAFSLPKNAKYSDEILKRVVIKNNENQTIANTGVKVAVEGEERATKLGTSPIKFSLTMPDGVNFSSTVNITVFSGIRVVEPKERYTYGGSIYEDGIDFLKYIEAYEIDSQGKEKRLEGYDAESGIGIKVLKTDLDVSVPGKYSILYRLTNSLGETLEHTSYVTVIKKKTLDAPTIQANDQLLYVGDVLTKEIILGWAKTTHADKVIFEVLDDSILVNNESNRLKQAGSYKIRYTASRIDEATQAELTAQKTITLTVKEKETVPMTSTPTTNVKKTAPTSANNAAVKSLPKTGSKTSDLNLILFGMALVGIVAFSAIKKKVQQ
ncbi:immunoglobulin-like domain-containing protein [Candidatus Enterococcus murrayae]|uniref:DUF5011 domain-containing protein n=1 Tax=Candidatus Enterococcus murrayae TaxID=2815321 RepID=A0ABS3HP53_9ENTE|nr:immunoglobulin-like domain-containing protein [Enterococcus sp. MJM16]MBO0455123.1 DUF5011 domain-containing protein [Enterococcus sp. MJM16]